jgi:hypothetical protein
MGGSTVAERAKRSEPEGRILLDPDDPLHREWFESED